MNAVERQGMIDFLILENVEAIKRDLAKDDPVYLYWVLEDHIPYSQWSDLEIEEEYEDHMWRKQMTAKKEIETLNLWNT
jgi:hypothetical protein